MDVRVSLDDLDEEPCLRPARLSQDDGIWAISCYFNPMGYRRRLTNFRTFRRYLRIPLVMVELSYRPTFELAKDDAEILIQVRGDSVLWQKERLLNVAMQALPPDCCKVAWLDCDIIFDDPSWSAKASSLLESVPIVQLFRQVGYLIPQATGKQGEVQFERPSSAYALAFGADPATCLGHFSGNRQNTCANGFAWAARRELIDRHGFFDAGIVGGGDRAMICAASQCFEPLMERQCMNEAQRQYYMAWAEPYCDTVRNRIGFLDSNIFHLWHGDVEARGGRKRHEGLQPFNFDPFNDISKAATGAWRWSTAKHEMHDYVRRYFWSRQEDG